MERAQPSRYETLGLEIADGVATITLNRPSSANAIDLAMARELADAALRCDEDPAVRAVVLTGAGKAFCAGGDLPSFSAAGDAAPALLKEITGHLHLAVSRLARMDAPVVAAVNGVAAEGARFTMAYTRAGLSPDGGATFFLSRLVGLQRARELVLTNRMLSALEAVEWGIAARVVADAELGAEVAKLAGELAAGPTRALGASKRLLVDGLTADLEAQLDREARSIAELSRTADGREGMAAFLDKRAARFQGR